MNDSTDITIDVEAAGALERWALEHGQVLDGDGRSTHELSLRSPTGAGWTASATDIFEALLRLRRLLEPSEIRVLCNGARLNAWASGMARDMGGGWQVYLLTPGEPADRRSLVPTLGPAPLDSIAASVGAQKQFFVNWNDGFANPPAV